MAVSNVNAFEFCHAHVQRSHVVSPSEATPSSKKMGRGGGGTKFPDHNPSSLASKGKDENASSSRASFHQSGLLKLFPLEVVMDNCNN